MMHAYLPFDPIHAATARHRRAFEAFQVAAEGIATVEANDEYDAAGSALLVIPITTRCGGLALLAHLRWWLMEESEYAAGHEPTYSLAAARAGDLALFLGDALPPAVIPTDLPPRRGLPPIRRRISLERRRVS